MKCGVTLPNFTAHNIALPGGVQTAPQFGLIAEGGVCQASLRTLRSIFRPEDISNTTIADLGCLEGGFAAAFAQAGFRSTGIEVRDLNIRNCRYVEEQLKLENLTFVQDDVRNVERYGPFDAVFCNGLLYHLDNPRSFLETLARATRHVLILQTHFASEEPPKDHAISLSPMTTHEGNRGRWYFEFSDEVSQTEMNENVWASWGNNKSFWIEKRHLLSNCVRSGLMSFTSNLITLMTS